MSLFRTLAEYFMYSHLPHFLYIAAMLCCSKDEEFFDEDFFLGVWAQSSVCGMVLYFAA
jgi:hypothetical protein